MKKVTFMFETSGNTQESIYLDLISQIAERIESVPESELSKIDKQHVIAYSKLRFTQNSISA